jgi:hypothetical protein
MRLRSADPRRYDAGRFVRVDGGGARIPLVLDSGDDDDGRRGQRRESDDDGQVSCPSQGCGDAGFAGATPACVCSLDGVTTGDLTTFAGCPALLPTAGPGVIMNAVATSALLTRCGAPRE